MQTKRGSKPQGSFLSRPLGHAQRIAAFLAVAVLVSGEGIVHRQLSDTGASEEIQKNILERGRSSIIVKGDLGGGGGHTSEPARGARSLDTAPHLGTSNGVLEEWQEGHKGKVKVPRCYSSTDADPSEGVWRKTDGGVNESPTMRGPWEAQSQKHFYHTQQCARTWGKAHPEDQEIQPYWVWEPNNCKLKSVTEARFCRVMEGRKGLLLVGDSLTRLSTTTLASILRAKIIAMDGMEDEWSACQGMLTVRFMRNDYLDVRTSPFDTEYCEDENGEPVHASRCGMFADNETLQKFDTLVVNSGAHPRPGEVYGPAMKVAGDLLAASMTSLHGDDAILIVRNTPPGHWGCTERMFDGPTNSSVATDLVNAAPPTYEWHNFHDNNVLLEEAFSPEHGWKLLDAFSPTLLRPDSHLGGRDCLHYCLPGPADHWIVLLYNIMLACSTEL